MCGVQSWIFRFLLSIGFLLGFGMENTDVCFLIKELDNCGYNDTFHLGEVGIFFFFLGSLYFVLVFL